MNYLRRLAYLFFIVIIIGLVIHIIEFFFFQTLLGMTISVIGVIGEIVVFAVHMSEKRAGEGKKFTWEISHIGVLAIILIVIGIIVNIICSFLFPDYVGIGNHFVTWGFIVAVIGFFVYVVKEKGFR
ncbi:MAG: hypothetical protein JSV39_02345 [Candidatus Aenigmatarchaeota archaeon]|nr:MAG: hypothetical protein JSV39_02345 [Candidatus Aenigmarchaeota archaeon]